MGKKEKGRRIKEDEETKEGKLRDRRLDANRKKNYGGKNGKKNSKEKKWKEQ